ncbi:MAG: histidinol-phosphatase HisJ family protein [Clostridiales bacterium]|nr:histidinol-phosphatase HisJ family protein [Clostridiales bacterium]
MYDYHTHSSFSDDCNIPMEEMVQTAVNKGVIMYAVTDHYDPDYPADEQFAFDLDFENYHKKQDLVQKLYNTKDFKMLKGIEIGLQAGDKTVGKCTEAVKYPYDFVIGSFHCIDYKDIWKPFHENMTPEKATGIYYEYILETINKFSDFDVLGHINALDRYIPYIPDFTPYREIVSEILRFLICKDKGLEINTSSFRYNMGNLTMPSDEILKMYRGLGGTIITFGSDSHFPEHICYRYDWAMEYLKSFGFNTLTVFENRVPEFVNI